MKIFITRHKISKAWSKMVIGDIPNYMQAEITSLIDNDVPEKDLVDFLKPLVIATIKLWIDEFNLKKDDVKNHLVNELIPQGKQSQEKIKTQISSFALAIGKDLSLEEKRSLIAQHANATVSAVVGIISYHILENDVWSNSHKK